MSNDAGDRQPRPDRPPPSAEKNPSAEETPPERPPSAAAEEERRYVPSRVAPGTWVRRLVVVLVLVALGYLAYLVAAAFFPRWWAQQIGDQVDGQITRGTLWGLFYGFLFTFVPLLLIAQIRRRFFNWTWRFIVLAVAILLAAPNWLTLAVVLGNSSSAHAGERIFDVDAPGFRAGTAIGVGTAVLIWLVLTYASVRLARRRKEVKELRHQIDERDRQREHRDSPGTS